jgi:protein O-mannosyl-transferase
MQEITVIKNQRRRRFWQITGAACTVFLFAVLLYARTLKFDFVWDDYGAIVHNSRVHSPSLALKSFILPVAVTDNKLNPAKMVAYNYRPLRTLVHSLVWQGAGNNPLYYHLLNILGHGAVSLMLFLVLHRLTRTILPALGGALLFAAHPVLTETVCWAKNFEDMMAGFFLLLTFYLILAMRRTPQSVRIRYIICAAICFALALLSKISVAFFPVFLVVQWLLEKKTATAPRLFSGISGRGVGLLTGIMGGASVVILALRHITVGRLSQSGYIAGDCWTTWLSMPRMFLRYLRLELIPTGLLADYQAFPMAESMTDGIAWRWAVFFVVVFVVISLAAWRTRLTLPWVWFWCALLPVANIVPMMQLGAERFLYLPTIGFAILGALLLRRIMNLSRSAGILLAFLCFIFYFLIFTFSTWHFSSRWRNDFSLWRDTVEKSPEALRPRKNLMKAFIKARQFKAALFHAAVLYRAAPTPAHAADLGFLECMEANSDIGFARLVKLKNDNLLTITAANAVARKRYDLAEKCFKAAIEINDKPTYRENLRRFNVFMEQVRKRKTNNGQK